MSKEHVKPLLQTAFEKMTDKELQAVLSFASDRQKGAAARLFVIQSQLEHELRHRGIIQKPKGINAITHPDEALAEIVVEIRANQTAHVNLVKGTKNAVAKIDDKSYSQTVRAHFGVSDFFGDETMKAARELDEGFFKSALEAVQDLKSRNRKAGEPKMLLHIEAAVTILRKGDVRGEKPYRKVTKQQLEIDVAKMLEGKAFSDRNSWQDFFKRPEIKPFVTQARGK